MAQQMGLAKLLSWNEFSALGELFADSVSAEGSWRWFDVLSKTTLSPKEQAVAFVLFDEDGKAFAGLPLAQERPGSFRALAAPYTTCYRPPVFSPDAALELGKCLARHVDGALRLGPLADDLITDAFLAGLRQGRLAAAPYFQFINRFDVIRDFERYWASRPSRLRETRKRKLIKASKQFQLNFGYITLTPQYEGNEVYQTVYHTSWKEPEPHPDFIPSLLKELAEDGDVRLATLTFAGKAVAAQIWLVRNQQATIFKLAHREEFKAFSPGTLLTAWAIEQASKLDGVKVVDFGRGDDTYKRDWLAQGRQRVGIIASNPRNFSGLLTWITHIFPTQLRSRFRKSSLPL